jgi:YHS domain-containing protein
VSVFVKDPEVFLNQLGVELSCAVNGERAAVIDEAHRRYVNWEVYFLSDEEAAGAFDWDPLRYCGLVTDPVSKNRFRPTNDSPKTVYQDRPYFFETAANLETFNQMPEGLANPAHKMVPKDAN